MSPVDDDSAKSVAKRVRDHLKKQEQESSNKTQANLHLDRDNYRKLQRIVGRGRVSAAVDLVIQYLIEELEKD